jgi:phosphatidylglycerol lysyltransferase
MGRLDDSEMIAERSGRRFGPLIGVVISIASLIALLYLASTGEFGEVRASLARIDRESVAMALCFTTLSYLVLTLYDLTALRTIGRSVPLSLSMKASFLNYALIHNFGFPLLTGAIARYRFYSSAGLSKWEIAKIIGFSVITFWLGVLALIGLVLVMGGGRNLLYMMPEFTPIIIGWLIIILITVYVTLCFRYGNSKLKLGRFTVGLPTGKTSLQQFAIATTDMVCAAAAFFVLIPSVDISLFPLFVASYVLAMGGALVSNAPGGIGVFEAIMLLSFPDVEKAQLFSALLAYRGIYYVIPLILAIFMWLHYESVSFRHKGDAARK